MNLYIQVKNGQPINHPATEENLLHALGAIDNTWETFVRTEMPVLGIYEVFDTDLPSYQKVDGVWTDFWHVREMTDEEKSAKQQVVKDEWNSFPRPNQTAWTFDEATCTYIPPIPRPTDDKQYFWQGTTNSWVVTPEYPTDGKQYKLDIPTATWVADSSTPSA